MLLRHRRDDTRSAPRSDAGDRRSDTLRHGTTTTPRRLRRRRSSARPACARITPTSWSRPRAHGLYPGRYVSGYLMREDTTEQAASHAWAGSLRASLGWVGFDPANGCRRTIAMSGLRPARLSRRCADFRVRQGGAKRRASPSGSRSNSNRPEFQRCDIGATAPRMVAALSPDGVACRYSGRAGAEICGK